MVRVENKDERRFMSLDRSLQHKGRELYENEAVAIEEHQAGELGVQRLHYLYNTLEATSAYDTR